MKKIERFVPYRRTQPDTPKKHNESSERSKLSQPSNSAVACLEKIKTHEEESLTAGFLIGESAVISIHDQPTSIEYYLQLLKNRLKEYKIVPSFTVNSSFLKRVLAEILITLEKQYPSNEQVKGIVFEAIKSIVLHDIDPLSRLKELQCVLTDPKKKAFLEKILIPIDFTKENKVLTLLSILDIKDVSFDSVNFFRKDFTTEDCIHIPLSGRDYSVEKSNGCIFLSLEKISYTGFVRLPISQDYLRKHQLIIFNVPILEALIEQKILSEKNLSIERYCSCIKKLEEGEINAYLPLDLEGMRKVLTGISTSLETKYKDDAQTKGAVNATIKNIIFNLPDPLSYLKYLSTILNDPIDNTHLPYLESLCLEGLAGLKGFASKLNAIEKQ